MRHTLPWIPAAMTLIALLASDATKNVAAEESSLANALVNQSFRLTAALADGVVQLRLDDLRVGACEADGPCLYHAAIGEGEDIVKADRLENPSIAAGGSSVRFTPVYYKYGLPGSYDMNWGFELMWSPMADIVEGRTTALYYANLGSNVPFYTHVNIAQDNVHCIIVWWYASTCRHLGIGGLHKDPKVVEAQQAAMRWYRRYDRFFKRGEFYGISEEIHLHVLPGENAFTVNVFNLSGEKKTIVGGIDLKKLGLNPSLKYVSAEGLGTEELGTVENGRYHVEAELPPWGAKVGAFAPQ